MKFKIAGYLSFALLVASCVTAQVPCTGTIIPNPSLFINWPQYGYDAGHTGCNPYESILSTNTVGTLTLKWAIDEGVTCGRKNSFKS